MIDRTMKCMATGRMSGAKVVTFPDIAKLSVLNLHKQDVFVSDGCFQWYRLLRDAYGMLNHPKSSGRILHRPDRFRNFAGG